ncbi:hypothetical protein FACS1894123_09630 [Bacteroidia bacterium]|nr:hypothetical protein FACS1894123_09630 [Bacteroidia bacterium]
MKNTVFFITMVMLCLFPTFSCKEEIYSTIPSAPVYVKLDLNFGDKELKSNITAYKIITKPRFDAEVGKLGFGGILVVNGGNADVNVDQLYAYDLACPVEVNRTIQVVPNNLSPNSSVSTAITATCPKCGARFNILSGNGYPEVGTKLFLRTYIVSSNGNNEYTVVN